MTATPAATTRLRSAVARWALLALLLGTGGPAHGQQPLPGTAPTVVAVQTRSAEQADASSLVRTRPWWPWLLFGRLHTVVVHFPIGLLGVAGAIEILHVVRRRPVPSEAATYCLVFGIAGAVIAVWFGTLNAGHQSFTGDSALTLERHRLMGWGVIVAAVAALGAGQLARRSVRMQTALVYLTPVVGTTAVVGATGHLGGQLVHGSEYITDVLPWNQRAEPVQARASQT
ncbi:MAG: DUF2231 domain-containing protein, partial [Luteitalea sp.]